MTDSLPSPAATNPSFEALNASLASYLDTLIPSKFRRSTASSTSSPAPILKRNPFEAPSSSATVKHDIQDLIARPGAVDSRGRLLYARPLTAQEIMAEAGAKQRDRRNLEIAKSKLLKASSPSSSFSSSSTNSALLKRKITEAQCRMSDPLGAGGDTNAVAGPSTSNSSTVAGVNGMRQSEGKQMNPFVMGSSTAAVYEEGKEEEEEEEEKEEDSRTRSVGKKTVRPAGLTNGKKKPKVKGPVVSREGDRESNKARSVVEQTVASADPTHSTKDAVTSAIQPTAGSAGSKTNLPPVISFAIVTPESTTGPSASSSYSGSSIPRDFTFATPAPPISAKSKSGGTRSMGSIHTSTDHLPGLQGKGHKRKASEMSTGTNTTLDGAEDDGDDDGEAGTNGDGKEAEHPELVGLTGAARKRMRKKLKKRAKGERD